MWTWDQEQKETSINKSFANAGKGVAILILGNIIAFVVLIILLKPVSYTHLTLPTNSRV